MELNGRKWGAIVMLMGEYNHTIDAKGRLIVPAKFREVLGDEFVVTKGLLPSVLREFAGLEKDVVLVGVASRIEIWSKDRWLQSISTYDDDMDEVAANMESLGFSI